ncbi:unnamed protein product (macronuclear) [Paramecium tetraurelia]|uniref:Protein kinase domain-containing protein n=1 Tax=Paramecium tetraurelia TaxID=5888 RepID=A0E5U9_PARTE|nr:uncharacterized protein GSPATT00003528001 [Paramecium tetraurelia]CAK90666.1 unnamed protein product [Paramecium tetraurelia]|eukprot:XP_001458063.1 hypothetical protein (macronuclear) [Paramecium tetraurelia strain d4-2]
MKFEHKKKFSVHLDISQLKSNSYLNYPLSTKRKIDNPQSTRKLDTSPKSVSPNNSFLSSERKLQQKYPISNSKTNSLKSMLQPYKIRSPSDKENHHSFLSNRSQLNKLPLSTEQFLKLYNLTRNEQSELNGIKQVYYYKQPKCLVDQPNGDYSYNIKDHIRYQYEIVSLLGQGSFGQVFQVLDHKTQQLYALKVIKNQEKLRKQAIIEANILQYIKDHDTDQLSNIVKNIEQFTFRGHQCIVFEKLEQNLFELIQKQKFKGIDHELARKVGIQLLNSLNFLNKHKIIHCDIKPENVMLLDNSKSGIKLVDFGSGCFVGQQIYTYIQSRYYRAPEVIFGLKYGIEIDMWSFACLISELYIGTPIFPGEDEIEQINLIIEVIGAPSVDFALRCPRRKYFFDEDGHPKKNIKSYRKPNSVSLYDRLRTEDSDLVDFLLRCFAWEPQNRLQPLDALKHPWIIAGLPKEIQKQHKKYIELEKLLQTQKTPLVQQLCFQGQKQNKSKEHYQEDSQFKTKKQIKSILNINTNLSNISDQKAILSCRYHDKPLQSERQRQNIASSIYKLLSDKPKSRKPSCN